MIFFIKLFACSAPFGIDLLVHFPPFSSALSFLHKGFCFCTLSSRKTAVELLLDPFFLGLSCLIVGRTPKSFSGFYELRMNKNKTKSENKSGLTLG